jgi:hypothetical protein
LEGNIFDCPNRDDDLPRQDPNYSTYICASDDYDEMLIIWGSLFACFVMLMATCVATYLCTANTNTTAGSACACVLAKALSWVDNLRLWNSHANAVTKVDGPHLYSFLSFLKLLRHFTTKLALLVSIMYSSMFVIVKVVGDEGTHTYQYRWLTSAAYLSGTTSATLMIVGLLCVMSFTFHSVLQFSTTINTTATHDQNVSSDASKRVVSTNTTNSFFIQKDSEGNWKRAYAIIWCGLTMNAILVLLVNGLYVYVVSWQDLGMNAVVTVQMSKSVFDILWNNVAIRMFMKRVKSTLRIKRLVRLVLGMLLFNTIMAPILSTLVTDSNCFVGMFVDNSEISTTTQLFYCAKLVKVNTTAVDFDADTSECEVFGTLDLETNYVPKFQYNYQCSSSFLANFIPIYVFTSGSVTFIVPMIQMTVAYLLTHKIAPDSLPIVPPGAYFPGVPLRRNPRHHVFSTDMVMH